MEVEYCYKLPENGKHRKISAESINKVLKAIDNYLKNPESGKKEIKQDVIPFIFQTLGFGAINKEVKQDDVNKKIPKKEDKARYFVAKLITIIEYMIKENPEKMQISREEKDYFIEQLDKRKNKSSNIRSDDMLDLPQPNNNKQGGSNGKGPYIKPKGTKLSYYEELKRGVPPRYLADEIYNDKNSSRNKKLRSLGLLLSRVKKYYNELIEHKENGEVEEHKNIAVAYIESLMEECK